METNLSLPGGHLIVKKILVDFIDGWKQRREQYQTQMMLRTFRRWAEQARELTRVAKLVDISALIAILQTSVRFNRTVQEKDSIRRFIVEHLHCIPKDISQEDMNHLCNEIDWVRHTGRSIIFLQGDYGNSYYLIARGSVGLYLLASKDQEIAVARDFGCSKGKAFQGTDLELSKLGNCISRLNEGSGFGESAIRNCSAVALEDSCVILTINADIYATNIRQHQNVPSVISMLQELPLFKSLNISSLSTIACSVKSEIYARNKVVATTGDLIQNAIFIVAGDIKAYASRQAASMQKANHVSKNQWKTRTPKIAISMLSKGMVIGEAEVFKDLHYFECSYEVYSTYAEIMILPVAMYREIMKESFARQSSTSRFIEHTIQDKEQSLIDRINRTRGYLSPETVNQKELRSKTDLVKCKLPLRQIDDGQCQGETVVQRMVTTAGTDNSSSRLQVTIRFPKLLSGKTSASEYVHSAAVTLRMMPQSPNITPCCLSGSSPPTAATTPSTTPRMPLLPSNSSTPRSKKASTAPSTILFVSAPDSPAYKKLHEPFSQHRIVYNKAYG